jgi:uncharacterized protein YaiL (DUF2058 family)
MATSPKAPEAKKVESAEAETAQESGLEKAYVKAVNGNMHHLFTGVVFTQDPKRVEIDDYVQAQLSAGKLEIVTE